MSYQSFLTPQLSPALMAALTIQLVVRQTPPQVLHLPCSRRSVLQKGISTVNMHNLRSFSFAQSTVEARCMSGRGHDCSAGLRSCSVLTVPDHAQNLKNRGKTKFL
jgi:hypothetical protein